MEKILFLDIDGVLNSERSVIAYDTLIWSNLVKKKLLLDEDLNSVLDSIAVLMLKKAHEELNFKIVISSTWRHHLSIKDFHKLFLKISNWDTTEIIIGTTPKLDSHRGKEINEWLNYHYPINKPEYCILDDSSDMLEEQKHNLVNVNPDIGFSSENYYDIFKIFNMESKFKNNILISS